LLDWHALDIDLSALGLSFSLEGVVLADSVAEGFSALTVTDMFDSDVNALGDDAVSNAFVDDNTNGSRVDVKDTASLSVIELVRHTGLLGTVSHNIDVIALLVDNHEFRKGVNTVSSVRTGEQISCASSQTKAMWHFCFKASG